MSTPLNDSRISDQLDHSFGDGPPPSTTAGALASGRSALLRRRAVTGISAAGAVAAVVVTFSLVGGGSPGAATEIAPAGAPSAAPSTEYNGSYEPLRGEAVTGESQRIRPANGVDVDLYVDGSLVKARGVTVLERIANPLGYSEPDYSLGIAYERDGVTTWGLLTYEGDSASATTSSFSSEAEREAFPSLESWLDNEVAVHSGAEPPSQLVEFGASKKLQPLDGVTILEQRDDVDLGPRFAGPGDPTAVAEVQVDGTRWYVLAREISGSAPEYLPTAARVGGDTLDDFLTYAEKQYASNEGVR